MLGNMGNNQQLPFDPQQLSYQPMQINPNAPPFVPMVTNDPNLNQVTPLAAGIAAAIINQGAGTNRPLRVFLFNQMVQNGYNNPDFVALVSSVIQWLEFEMIAGRVNNSNIHEAIKLLTDKCVVQYAASNVRKFPALSSYLDASTQQSVMQTLQEASNIWASINQAFQQPQRVQQQPQYQPMQQNNQTYNSGNVYNPAQQVHTQSRFPSNQPQQLDTLAHRGGNTRPQVNKPVQQVPPPQPQPIVQQPQPMTQITDRPDSWIPSSKYRFQPAYRAVVNFATLDYDSEGEVKVTIRERESEMFEQGDHEVINPLKMPVKNKTLAQIREESRLIHEAVKEFNSPSANAGIVGEGVSGLTVEATKRSPTIFSSSSVELALIFGDAERYKIAAAENNKIPDLHRIVVDVFTPSFGTEKEQEALVILSNCSSYTELKKELLDFGKDLKPFVNECDYRITQAINRQLQQNIGMTQNISSFLDDVDELVDMIEENYGIQTKDAFLKYAAKYIRSIFKVMAPEDAEKNSCTYLQMLDESIPENLKPKVTFFTNRHCYTYLNRALDQLDLGIADSTEPFLLDEEQTPALYQLVKGVFDEMKEIRTFYTRAFLRLEDGHIFELTKGFLGDDAYLMKLIK